jgi:uncharacterized protein (TIGR00255 family)
MSLKSMTGFARCTGGFSDQKANFQTTSQQQSHTAPDVSWTVELRSVNGKGLDLRLRLPTGLEALEQPIKNILKEKLGRGNVSLNLNLAKERSAGRIELDEEAFMDVLGATKRAAELSSLTMPDLGTLLQTRSVLMETETEESEEHSRLRNEAILRTVNEAIISLVTARKEEGTALTKIVQEKVDTIQSLTNDAILTAKNQEETLKARLKEQLKTLLEETATLSEDRLHQEAMLLVVKADINEELDRLSAHIEQAKDLISRDEPVGRRLDFLCQEFNREANTLCSKSASKELTYIGLELKTVIDQLREQVQNIE